MRILWDLFAFFALVLLLPVAIVLDAIDQLAYRLGQE